MTSKKINTVLYYILTIILGVVFLLSAITKLYPIEPLEYMLVESSAANWQSSLYLARILIGLEMACGILLIIQFKPRKFTVPFVWLLLTLFSGYLFFQWYKYGNAGNCGCFGDAIQMTPVQALFKNLLLLIISVILYILYPRIKYFHVRKLIKIVLLPALILCGLVLPFILNPLPQMASQEVFERENSFRLNLDTLYNNSLNPPASIELRYGKRIISFMSLSCAHCKLAAKKLHVIKTKNPRIPIHLILNGKPSDLQPFFEETRANNLTWNVLNGPELFMGLAGVDLPKIYWVDNGMVVNETNVYTLDQAELETWLSKP